MSLKVVNSKVVFEYRVNGVPRSLTNWEVGVSDGLWRRVYATRYKFDMYLKLRDKSYFKVYQQMIRRIDITK